MKESVPSRLRSRLVFAVTALCCAGFAGAAHAGPAEPRAAVVTASEAPYLAVKSPYPLAQTVERVKAAAHGHNFRFIREQALDYGFVPAAAETRHGRTLYFCDFGMLNEALKVDRRIGLFLPCQVSVVDTGEGVLIVAPNPKVLSREFIRNARLERACNALRTTYAEILDEATM